MSPRRNLPRRQARQVGDAAAELDERTLRGAARLESAVDGDWAVRFIAPGTATKTYRCPGCDHEIGVGVAHVVAWPADGRGDLADRRHWHSACWTARHRRRPSR